MWCTPCRYGVFAKTSIKPIPVCRFDIVSSATRPKKVGWLLLCRLMRGIVCGYNTPRKKFPPTGYQTRKKCGIQGERAINRVAGPTDKQHRRQAMTEVRNTQSPCIKRQHLRCGGRWKGTHQQAKSDRVPCHAGCGAESYDSTDERTA